ncbi:phytanoyl-CoA dioxygenase family protein [Haloglomus litoreum]|uniref:phytanoyl-CoA dioxygenase family protein n=1 Tax=Haloglomus litoreum TaxID=3034026 RepID=UPI0023E8C139|nr:phytanoyl-CoA dioxygenase family protein [Haloglomus sp. DT116]
MATVTDAEGEPATDIDVDADTYAATLAADGVVVVEDFFAPSLCDEIREAVESRLDGLPRAGPDDDYGSLATRGEPVVRERTGENDDGMLDVFNMGLAVPALAQLKRDRFVAEVINGAAAERYTPDNLNVYVNRGVTDTRDFHADTYAGKFKSFVYLTDVPDERYGPFQYIPGSHEPSVLRRKAAKLVNRVRGNPSTDGVFYDDDDALVCTASKGTLIIADQGGLHRGTPQEPGFERMLATTSYTPAGADHH